MTVASVLAAYVRIYQAFFPCNVPQSGADCYGKHPIRGRGLQSATRVHWWSATTTCLCAASTRPPTAKATFRSGSVPRGDGRLSHDLNPQQPGPQDACGVFGVWAPGEEVAKLTYFGLYALQHRGQEAAGIAVSDGASVVVYKDLGLVSQVFDEPTLGSLRGHLAVGHTRY